MTLLIDSSVWVALFLDFDTQHGRAVRLFARVREPIYVPYCVIAEVTTVLAYKHSKEQADLFLQYIESAHDIVIFDDNADDEICFYETLVQRISFTDGALLLLARQRKARLITFDTQLKRIARRIPRISLSH